MTSYNYDIKLIIYDFDGVMTDNKALLFNDGSEAVYINRSDGLAISEIRKSGLIQYIVTTEKNKIVDKRAEKLTIPIQASWLYSTRIFKDPKAEGGFGHVHCFDYDYMEFRLRRIGFRKIWRSSFQGSILPELRSNAFDRCPHDSLCVEAIK